MNKPVNFPIAKLLKEKGFDENCSDYYTKSGNLNSNGWGDIIYEDGFGLGERNRMLTFNYLDFSKHQKETCFLCPTIADVVMWLYEKYGIWISVYQYKDHAADNNDPILFRSNITGQNKWLNESNTPTKEYEAAIEYTLNKLI